MPRLQLLGMNPDASIPRSSGWMPWMATRLVRIQPCNSSDRCLFARLALLPPTAVSHPPGDVGFVAPAFSHCFGPGFALQKAMKGCGALLPSSSCGNDLVSLPGEVDSYPHSLQTKGPGHGKVPGCLTHFL